MRTEEIGEMIAKKTSAEQPFSAFLHMLQESLHSGTAPDLAIGIGALTAMNYFSENVLDKFEI